MFLLLMPIFAAPGEALAAFIFMAAGVPMYYLTARSRARASGKGYARLDNEDDGIRATLGTAWDLFVDDVVPRRWQSALQRSRPTPVAVDGSEERRGMLTDRIEMSEI